jgi:hypothetical protein
VSGRTCAFLSTTSRCLSSLASCQQR